MLDPNAWFIEVTRPESAAFALAIREKLHEERTPYQLIEVFATERFGNLMTIDGIAMLTTRESFLYHEMMSHPALFTHPDPRRVCIIGGGDCGTLTEVLKHPEVESAVQIDIDEGVTRAARLYFPELAAAESDPRATLLFADGIQWIKDAEPGSLDLIIVDSTDPIGPAVGLFGQAFHESCIRALAPGGIFVQQSESPLYNMQILTDLYKAMRGAGFADRKTLFFPQTLYPSGWWTATMARKGELIEGLRIEDALNKPFKTLYYNAEIHQGALAQPEFFRHAISSL